MLLNTLGKVNREDLLSYHKDLVRRVNETNEKYHAYQQQMNESPYEQYLYDDQLIQQRDYPYGEGFRALYPGLLTYQLPEIYKILVNPEKICPLLKSLTEENQLLKEELEMCCDQLLRFIKMDDNLIEENKSMAQHMLQKDEDFLKRVQLLNLTETSEIQDLEKQCELYKDENVLLQRVIFDLKQDQQESQHLLAQQKQEIQNAKDLTERIKFDFLQSKQREDELTRQIHLLQPKIEEFAAQSTSYQSQCEDIEKELNHSLEENNLLNQKMEEIERDLNDKVEVQGSKIEKYGHLVYGNEITIENLRLQLEVRDQEIHHLREEKSTLWKENDEIRILYDQLNKEADQQAFQLSYEKKRIDGLQITQGELIKSKEQTESDYESLKLHCDEIEREIKIILIQSQEDFNDLKAKNDKNQEYLKNKYTQSLREKEEQIDDLQNQLHELKIQYDDLDNDNARQVNEINESKQKLLDYLQLQRIIDSQSWEIRQREEEILNIKQNIQDLQDDNEKLEKDYHLSIEKFEKDISNLDSLIDEQKHKLEEKNRQIEQLSKIKDERNKLEKEIDRLNKLRIKEENEIENYKEQQHQLEIDKIQFEREQNELKSQQVLTRKLQNHLKELTDENSELRHEINDLQKELKKIRSLSERKKSSPDIDKHSAKQLDQKHQSPVLPRGYSPYEPFERSQPEKIASHRSISPPPIIKGRNQDMYDTKPPLISSHGQGKSVFEKPQPQSIGRTQPEYPNYSKPIQPTQIAPIQAQTKQSFQSPQFGKAQSDYPAYSQFSQPQHQQQQFGLIKDQPPQRGSFQPQPTSTLQRAGNIPQLQSDFRNTGQAYTNSPYKK